MKVSNIMHKKVETINVNDTVRDAARLIFGRSINGLPVTDGKKIVGFLTEKDILNKFYPSVQEYMEDIVHSGNFEEMESKVSEILALPVKKIMNTDITTIDLETPILEAQSLMNLRKVGRLPVVNKKGELVGILTKGDIFNSIIGSQLPFYEEESFYNWISGQYDVFNDWKVRLPQEIPHLTNLFKKNKVKRVLDIASSTGEHSIALAEAGFEVVGIEKSPLINKVAEDKRSKLPEIVKNRLTFIQGNYTEKLEEIKDKFDAVIFMGNALSHVEETDPKVLEEAREALNTNGVIFFQTVNYEKILVQDEGLWSFVRRKLDPLDKTQVAFLGFYTKEDSKILYTHAYFDFDGKNWIFKGVQSTLISFFDKQKILDILKNLRFKNIKVFGASKIGPLLKTEFRESQSDWLNVVAKK